MDQFDTKLDLLCSIVKAENQLKFRAIKLALKRICVFLTNKLLLPRSSDNRSCSFRHDSPIGTHSTSAEFLQTKYLNH